MSYGIKLLNPPHLPHLNLTRKNQFVNYKSPQLGSSIFCKERVGSINLKLDSEIGFCTFAEQK